MYVTCDVLMCTSSILHLCTISLERYLAISRPLLVRNKSKGVVLTKIVLVWILSSAITSPITILGFMDHKNVLNNDQCVLTNEDFIIYGSTGAFIIPLGIMVITYSLTVRLLRKQADLCGQGRDNEGQPMIRRSTSRKPIKFRQVVKFEPRRTKSCPAKNCKSYNQYYERTRSVKSCSNGVKLNVPDVELTPPPSPLYSNSKQENAEAVVEENHNGMDWRKQSVATTCSSLSNESPTRLKNLMAKHQVALRAASMLLLKRDKDNQHETSSVQSSPRHNQDDVNTEQKASKVLGVVFVIFVICWAPFFIVNIMTVLCKECEFHPLLITAFVWLGYVSSILNPIIYTMFNKTFKMTFIKLLKCQYKTIQKSLRVRWHSRNGYQSTFRTHSYYSNESKAESQL